MGTGVGAAAASMSLGPVRPVEMKLGICWVLTRSSCLWMKFVSLLFKKKTVDFL